MTRFNLMALLALALAPTHALADALRAGDHTIHYNAMHTTELTPEVARASGITRSAGRVLINIAVRRDSDDGLGTPVAAEVTVDARNELGQMQSPRMREVREADAIYYLGEIRVGDGETYSFDLQVRPEGAERPIRGRWRQEFHAPDVRR